MPDGKRNLNSYVTLFRDGYRMEKEPQYVCKFVSNDRNTSVKEEVRLTQDGEKNRNTCVTWFTGLLKVTVIRW